MYTQMKTNRNEKYTYIYAGLAHKDGVNTIISYSQVVTSFTLII